ncbi:glycosyltransferase family 2 protein [Petrimonas sulfuriphila]|uniref:glycosyltransferase family 2 protein n=1 Tax=Petrimonas sulfuriphila TaxID=285070 RepID=UPI003EBE800D
MKYNPLVSVIMPVYNYGHLIKESIDSVLAQTLPDFELIVVNDGSTDNSRKIAHSYLDKRIKIINFPENRGCYPAMNAGMRVAKGEYLCVVGSDDINLPKRLEKQYLFLEENKELGMIGSAFQMLNDPLPYYKETDYETIKVLFLRNCYSSHATCMVRTALVQKYDLYYNESYTYSSDYDWQVRALSLFPASNINEIFYQIRMHEQQITKRKGKEQFFFMVQIRMKQLSFFRIKPTESEKALHNSFINGMADCHFDEKLINQWIDKLLEANRVTRYYSQQKLQNFLQAHCNQYVFQMKQT